MGGAWEWLNLHLIETAINLVVDEAGSADVIDVVDQILLDPTNPQLEQTLILGRGKPDRVMFWLPRDHYLSVSFFANGPPPYAGPHIVVRSMGHVSEIGRDK